MPNALDYRAAAERCRRLAADLADQADRRAVDPGDVAGGPVEEAFDASLDVTADHLRHARDELGRLASVCEHRAEICAEYARAVWRHAQLDVIDRWLTRPPAPPAAWVEL